MKPGENKSKSLYNAFIFENHFLSFHPPCCLLLITIPLIVVTTTGSFSVKNTVMLLCIHLTVEKEKNEVNSFIKLALIQEQNLWVWLN